MSSKRISAAFTIIEMLVVIVVIGILAALLLPNLRMARGPARRMSCSNNFKQIGLGLHNYYSAYKQLPMQMGGTFDPNSDSDGTFAPGNNRYRLSFLVGVIPFIEGQALWEQISNEMPVADEGIPFAPMGPAPWTREYEPWQTQIPNLRCPSDPGDGLPAHGRTNYVACLGDATHCLDTGAIRFDPEVSQWVVDRTSQVEASGRGFFVPRQVTRFTDIIDGLANTIMAGEICTDLEDRDMRTSGSLSNSSTTIHDNPLLCRNQINADRPNFWRPSNDPAAPSSIGDDDQRRGSRWADGAALYTSFNTILPPNTEVCLTGGDAGIGMLSVSSRHPGGTHVLMGDGAVKFITDSMEAGDSGSGTVMLGGVDQREPGAGSPYGLWGTLGTRASGETIEEEL